MKRYHIIFKGRVQGVGFRFQVKMLADRLGVTGTVRNMYDGSVEVYIQGNENQIMSFFKGLENINFAIIDSKNINEVSVIDGDSDFQVVY
ncbi:acylphosphatase [Anaerococcus degeneri]|uniref:acylphosphatase n=1 Tax=Anaerococcus degeneri TaxID=361500 RepID=A0ABS7YUD3_9FIRM|nr:acylphosphatase [Anaerococcus degeneri]MBP2015075.1 acylphosphatase [Anaerococcus degeneri]MCA2095335.1 acylphosphatase [Anaerococcus degeneri]